MNKPIVTLIIAAAVLGSAAAWQLHQLDVERERAAATAAKPPETELPGITLRSETGPQRKTAQVRKVSDNPPRDTAPDPRPVLATDADHQARQRRQAAEFLRKYADPGERAALRQATLDGVRRSTAGLEQRLNLDSDQYERLVQLLADQEMERRAAAARCIVEPACVSPVLDSALFTSTDQAIRDIVGDENLKELRSYRAAEVERRTVTRLQSRLPDGRVLTQAQADDLTRALFDEKNRQMREMHYRQQHIRGYGMADGPSLFYADDAATPELAMQSGEAYVQAMRDRAAMQLTGEQLSALNAIYDDLLLSFGVYMRQNVAQRSPPEATR